MSNELAPANVFELVNQQETFFNNVNNASSVAWSSESQFAIQQLQKNDFLQKTAFNNIPSIQNAIINVAAIGISLNPANKHAYLVPRDGMVCLDVSYMGLKHLAEKSGAIEWMQAKLVYEKDQYSNNGVDKAPTHSQNTFGDKGKIIGAYCTVKLPNGDYLTEEMDIDALNKIAQTSKAKNGPWKTFPEEMMRKTVVKRAAKYWPSPKGEMNLVNKAIDVINEHEGIDEPELYTEEEKQEFDRMIKDSLSFSLAAYMASCDEEKQTALFNSFPKGEITKNKNKARELQSIGFQEWQSFTVEIREYIQAEDSNSLIDVLENFENYEKKMLANLLGEPDTTTLKELLSNVH